MRLQLFEFNDASWAPEPLRDSVIEALSRMLRWGRMLDGLADPLGRLIDESGATEVLDLASGAGGPVSVLIDALGRSGRTPHFTLSDLQPQVEAWTALEKQHPGQLSFVPEPVDATALEAALTRGRLQLIINAFHHLPPPIARAVVRSACEHAPAVMISEAFVRNPLRFFQMSPIGLAALLANPILSPRHRLAKALLTWFSPIAMAVSVWDGTVSTMRVYSEAELREMVRDVPGQWRWDYGTWPCHGALGGKSYWFSGVRLGR